MADPALATPEDAARYGYDLPEQDAHALLERASARIRRAAGQTITVAEVSVRLPVDQAAVQLPAPPIRGVHTVRDIAPDGSSRDVEGWGWDGVRLSGLGSALLVEVAYSRGYDPVPAGIVELSCQVAHRLANTSAGMEWGVRQQSIDNYSVTYAVEQLDAAGDLLPGELRALECVLGTRNVWMVETL